MDNPPGTVSTPSGHTHTHRDTHTHTETHTHTQRHTNTHTHRQTHRQTHTHTQTHTQTHTHTHRHIHTDTHTHTDQNHWKSIGFTRLSAKNVVLYKVVREKCCFHIGFMRLSAKSDVFTLVLQGCPRKVVLLHWFYKGCPRKVVFYIGFTKVVREKPYKTRVKTTLFVDNPPGTVSPTAVASKLPSQQP